MVTIIPVLVLVYITYSLQFAGKDSFQLLEESDHISGTVLTKKDSHAKTPGTKKASRSDVVVTDETVGPIMDSMEKRNSALAKQDLMLTLKVKQLAFKMAEKVHFLTHLPINPTCFSCE